MMKLNARAIFLALFFFCTLLLGVSFLMQYGFHLKPCSLCLIDRALIILITFFLAMACWHHPKALGQRIYGMIIFLLAASGILVTARHLWLLHLPPDKAPACGPDMAYLLQTLPFSQVIEELLLGSGECAQYQGAFLGLSLPGWTMIAFMGVAIGASLIFRKQVSSKK